MSESSIFNSVLYPYTFTFKIGTLHNDFVAKDATGVTKAFVKQKLFRLKEDVLVYSDETKSELKYRIRANKWLDFNTSYLFTDANENSLGRVVRKGWRSVWKAHYELYDEKDQQDLIIHEKNAWVKVMDSVLSEIPVVGIFTGYLFNPSYLITRPDGTLVCTLKKEPSFWGRRFKLYQNSAFESGEETRVHLGVMMMALLERRRG